MKQTWLRLLPRRWNQSLDDDDMDIAVRTSDLSLSPVVQVRQSFPDTCNVVRNDWLEVDSEGRCIFTDCTVGQNGIGSDCFACGSSCDNGCSLVPDSIPLSFDFGEPCCNHDHCYSSKFSQAICDANFFIDMLESCTDSIFFVINIPLGLIRPTCPEAAVVYYNGVRLFGRPAYDARQRELEAHEQSPACALMCPTTQRSGGQGTTTLNVDLMVASGTFEVSYDHFGIPDQVTVRYEGNVLLDTGSVSGSATVAVSFSGQSTVVTVTVSAPLSGTAWNLAVACPQF